MRIAVIGSGGVGGFYGAKLQQAGCEVTFVARGAHYEAMRAHGLAIERDDGQRLHLPKVDVTDDLRTLRSPDLILVAVKLWDLEEVAGRLAAVAGPQTAVLGLQNGVTKDEILTRVFGARAVIGGVAYVATSIGRPGVIAQVGTMARVRLGEYDGQRSERIDRLVRAFASQGVDAEQVDDIRRVLWEKYTLLVGLSGLTCVTRLSIGQVREHPRTRALLQSVMRETVAVGRALGVALPADYAEQCMQLADRLPYPMVASMRHDLEQGNRIELPWLSGGVATLGHKAGVETPVNGFIADVLAPCVNGRPASAPR